MDQSQVGIGARAAGACSKTVGLITAFSIANASQHELQLYCGLMEDPVVKLAAKIRILTSVLATRLEGIEKAKSKN
jgi:hypothetical protein